MRRVLFTILLAVVCTLSFSQERVNTEKYLQFDKTTKALKKVMGYKGISGEWKCEKNQIYSGFFGDTQKFNRLSVKTIMYNDTLYYVLIRNGNVSASSDRIVKSGDVYKYRSGGGSYNCNILYFFTAPEFEKIFYLNKKTITISSFRIYTSFEKSNVSKLSDYLIRGSDKNKKKDFMQIRIADNGKMVRFLLPYQKDEPWPKDYDVFTECYFEMPLKDFNKWLKPVSPLEE